MNMNRICMVILCLAVAGCDNREAPKTPLGETAIAASGITGDARLALDSGNRLFRAKLYDAALTQYERSARLVPVETAPLLGIMMVADVKKDQRLADATLARMKKLNPDLADPDAVSSHAKAMKQHPPIESSMKLPPPHPPIGGTAQPPSTPSRSLQ